MVQDFVNEDAIKRTIWQIDLFSVNRQQLHFGAQLCMSFFFLEFGLEIRESYVIESCASQKLNVLRTTSHHKQFFTSINAAGFQMTPKNSQELVSPLFGSRCPYLLFRD